jgi:hypothetical protein
MDSEIGDDNCIKDLILVGRRSKSGSKEEEAVEAVDEIDDVDVCHAVVGMDSEIGDDNCTKDLILVGRRSESGSKMVVWGDTKIAMQRSKQVGLLS